MMFRQRLGERGATLVEFAIAIPVFLALMFGIVELGVSFWKRIVVDDAVQTSGRLGAALGNAAEADMAMLESIGDDLGRLGNNAVGVLKYVEIYRVDAAGNATGDLNFYTYTFTPDPSVCDWTPCPEAGSAAYGSLTWKPENRKVKVGDLDVIGVKAYFAHSWITGLMPWANKDCIAGSRATTCFVEDTTMRLEPLQFDLTG